MQGVTVVDAIGKSNLHLLVYLLDGHAVFREFDSHSPRLRVQLNSPLHNAKMRGAQSVNIRQG